MKVENYVTLEFLSRSTNEAFARTAAAAFAAQLDPTLDEVGDIRTAVSEAVTNAIVHAYPDKLGKIVMKLRILEGGILELTVRDWGRGIDNVQQARQPLFTTGGEERSGMGFTIMESFMDKLTRKGNRGVYAQAHCTAAVWPSMSSGELFALLDRAQNGDDAACEQVLQENAGLIWSIVRRYYGCGVETDDLYQLGCIGFIKAVKGFNLTYGTQFSTYAVPKIAGEIRRFLRDDGAIKVGRSIREKGQALSAARERLRYRLGRDPRLSELSEETGLTPEEIASVELATGVPESLQQETAEGLTLESTLGTDSPEESMVERIALREAIDALPEREKMTILLRFFKGLTQEQTARILGVSQVQVSRLERRGLANLRKLLDD